MREMEEFVREQASKGCFKAQWMDQKLETVQEAVEVFSSAGFEVTEQETRRGRILTIDWSNA